MSDPVPNDPTFLSEQDARNEETVVMTALSPLILKALARWVRDNPNDSRTLAFIPDDSDEAAEFQSLLSRLS